MTTQLATMDETTTITPDRTATLQHRLLQAAGLLALLAIIVGLYAGIAWLDTSLHSASVPQGYSNSQVFGQVAHQFAQRVREPQASTTAYVRPVPRILHLTVPDNGHAPDCSVREINHRAVITLAGTDISFPAVCKSDGGRAAWDELPS